MKKGLILLLCLSFLPVFLITPVAHADDQQIIRVGLYENRPKIFTDEKGNASGFWPDITQSIVSDMGWQIEYIHGTWEECLIRLENNEIDVMPDMAYSEDRSTRYVFGKEPVYVSWSLVYTRKGIDVQSVVDLEGKNIAVLQGSVNVEGPEGIKKLVDAFHVNCTFIETDSYLKVFEMIDSGKADAGVTSKDFGHIHEADYQVDRTPIIFAPSSLYFAFPKDSSLTPYLAESFDTYIKQLKGDQGSLYYRSMEYWMGIRPVGKSVLPPWMFWLFISILGLAFIFALISFTQRSKVKTRTKELAVEISERKKYEEMDKLKSDLLSMVSHELRTPLSTVKGYSTMLIDYRDKMDEQERLSSLTAIDKAADRLVRLVDQLLDMSRIEAGLLKMEKELTDPVHLIQQIIQEARVRFPEFRFETDIEKPNLPMAYLDVNRIRQVMDNLIDNAVKYSENTKKIDVSVACLDGNLFFSVTDYGIGIPEHDHKRIFERMYRIEHKTSPSKPGLGLGLPIAKGIVEAHGGRIWAENSPGQGSRLIFTVPVGE